MFSPSGGWTSAWLYLPVLSPRSSRKPGVLCTSQTPAPGTREPGPLSSADLDKTKIPFYLTGDIGIKTQYLMVVRGLVVLQAMPVVIKNESPERGFIRNGYSPAD